MTLTTTIEFLEPVDPEAVFGFMRQAIGIPADQPVTVTPPGDHYNLYANATCMRSEPGDYPAGLWMYVCPEGVARLGDESMPAEQWFVQLMLDTSYGYRPCCTCLHMYFVWRLHQFADGVAMRWQDEYTGEWHSEAPTSGCPSHRGRQLGWALGGHV